MTLRTGLLLLPSRPVPEMAALVARAEALGYDDVWLADERFFREVYATLTVFAQSTRRVRLGPCVTDPYSRHPALTAMAIATLDEIAGGRAVLGFGAGVSGLAELGIDSSRSATAIREGIDLVRRLLAGATVTLKGEQISFHNGRLDWAPARAGIPIYVASQRAAGCRVAGRVADGAIMQGALAEPLVRFLRDTVHGAAREAGRDPARIELVARLNTCIHAARGCGVRGRQARSQRYFAGDDLSARGRGRPGDNGGALPARGHAARAARASRVTVTVHMHGNLRRFMPGGADRLEMTLAVGTT